MEVVVSFLGTGNVTCFLVTRMLLQHLDGKHRWRMHSSPVRERKREVCALTCSRHCSPCLKHPHSAFPSGKVFVSLCKLVLCKSEEGLPPGQSSITSPWWAAHAGGKVIAFELDIGLFGCLRKGPHLPCRWLHSMLLGQRLARGRCSVLFAYHLWDMDAWNQLWVSVSSPDNKASVQLCLLSPSYQQTQK